MTRPLWPVVTPCHSPIGASLSQFSLEYHSGPPAALYRATSASRSVSGDVCANGRLASGVAVAVGGAGAGVAVARSGADVAVPASGSSEPQARNRAGIIRTRAHRNRNNSGGNDLLCIQYLIEGYLNRCRPWPTFLSAGRSARPDSNTPGIPGFTGHFADILIGR